MIHNTFGDSTRWGPYRPSFSCSFGNAVFRSFVILIWDDIPGSTDLSLKRKTIELLKEAIAREIAGIPRITLERVTENFRELFHIVYRPHGLRDLFNVI